MSSQLGGPSEAPENPYAAPKAPAEPPPAGEAPTRAELEAYVGKNAGYYWHRLTREGGGTSLFRGWNWASAFFSMIWLLYRRMWAPFWVSTGVLFVWGVVEAFAEESTGGKMAPAVDRLLNLAMFILFGTIGNGLYLRRARARIEESRRLFPNDPEGQRAHLARRGGTSWIAVVIAVAVFTALAVLGAVAADAEG